MIEYNNIWLITSNTKITYLIRSKPVKKKKNKTTGNPRFEVTVANQCVS